MVFEAIAPPVTFIKVIPYYTFGSIFIDCRVEKYCVSHSTAESMVHRECKSTHQYYTKKIIPNVISDRVIPYRLLEIGNTGNINYSYIRRKNDNLFCILVRVTLYCQAVGCVGLYNLP